MKITGRGQPFPENHFRSADLDAAMTCNWVPIGDLLSLVHTCNIRDVIAIARGLRQSVNQYDINRT